MSQTTSFHHLEQIVAEQGALPALEWLADHFHQLRNYSALFEIRKMQARHSLGLELLYRSRPDQLDEATQRSLEDKLLDVCREIGSLYFQEGQIREGWMYLQPVGDRALNQRLLSQVTPDEDNAETLIDIALHEGAFPELGFRLLLQQLGTCNSITTFDSICAHFEKPVRQQLAHLLVDHLYRELTENIGAHIVQQESDSPKAESLTELLEGRPWLTEGGNHHIDTTHLASVLRIGRLCENPDALEQLHQMAQYGQRLNEDFHYQGQPPFENIYDDHELFYRALSSGQEAAIGEAIRHFNAKTKSVERSQFGAVAFETLVDLLDRLGRRSQAIDVYTEALYGHDDLVGIANSIFELPQSQDELDQLTDYFRDQDDLLAFSVSLLMSQDRPASVADATKAIHNR